VRNTPRVPPTAHCHTRCPPPIVTRVLLLCVACERTEHHEVSAEHPEMVEQLSKELEQLATTIWSTDHPDDLMCKQTARSRYGGFYGPWLEVGA
jgi:hypothetical protein